MAVNETILRLPRTDKPRQHLLVQVSKNGSKALDLKLIGTEHEHLYHAQLEESKVKSLQANSFSGDLTEWKAVLKYVLLHERPAGQLPDYLQGLENVANITGKEEDENQILTITIRKNIGGITQRLGDIKLKQDDGPVISIFEWVDSAIATADSMRTELETLQASMEQQSEQVTSLNKQLDDLVKAKKEHEDELLAKFTALLNAKKLKIRDQQRLLAGAQIDAAVAEAVGNSRDGLPSKSSGPKKGKRKVGPVEEDEDAEMNDEEEEEDEQPQVTPPGSDDDATEDEDDLGGPAPTVTSSKGRSQMEIDEPEEPPSRRELPSRSQQSKPEPAPQQSNDNDDDDETDDEL